MKNKIFKLKYKNKIFNINVDECQNTIDFGTGLMFKKNSLPILFNFKKPKKYKIHSFFCTKFIAIWLNKGKIIEIKNIDNWKLSITPKNKFDKLLEIPINSEYYNYFTDDTETFIY